VRDFWENGCSSIKWFAVTAGLDLDHPFVKRGEVLLSARPLRPSSGGLALALLLEGENVQPAACGRAARSIKGVGKMEHFLSFYS